MIGACEHVPYETGQASGGTGRSGGRGVGRADPADGTDEKGLGLCATGSASVSGGLTFPRVLGANGPPLGPAEALAEPLAPGAILLG